MLLNNVLIKRRLQRSYGSLVFQHFLYSCSELHFSYSSFLMCFTRLSSAKVLPRVGGIHLDRPYDRRCTLLPAPAIKCPWVPETNVPTQPGKSQVLHIYTTYVPLEEIWQNLTRESFVCFFSCGSIWLENSRKDILSLVMILFPSPQKILNVLPRITSVNIRYAMVF